MTTLRERWAEKPLALAAEVGAVMYLVGALLHVTFLWWLDLSLWLVAATTLFWPLGFLPPYLYYPFLGVGLLAGLVVAKRRG